MRIALFTMDKKNTHSTVEIVYGEKEVRISGSENFVSDELSNILNEIDLTSKEYAESKVRKNDSQAGQKSGGRRDSHEPGNNSTNEQDPLQQVSGQLNVPAAKLREHFYVEESSSELVIHIQYPTKIPEEFALIGYCTIKEVLTGQTYYENKVTKQKLIDEEKVTIDEWGRKFLHKLRKSGLIRDDPNSKKSRNRPFKITPKGREELAEWLSNNS